MGALILLGIGFVSGGIIGVLIACLCAASRSNFDEEEFYENEDDKGEW